MKSLLLLILSICFPLLLRAQAVNDSLLFLLRNQVEERNYTEANNTLKIFFSAKNLIPDEVAYWYGKVQLGLNNNIKAREAFQKYIALTDSQGVYYNDALRMIEESERGICKECSNTGTKEVKDTCTICEGSGKITIQCKPCNGRGLVYCPSCKGNGVVLKSGSMGSIYQTCSNCNGKGIAACNFCKGSGKTDKFCNTCKGVGYNKRKEVCNHKDQE